MKFFEIVESNVFEYSNGKRQFFFANALFFFSSEIVERPSLVAKNGSEEVCVCSTTYMYCTYTNLNHEIKKVYRDSINEKFSCFGSYLYINP